MRLLIKEVIIDKFNIMGENLGTLKEKLCCEGVVSPEENETFNPNQGK